MWVGNLRSQDRAAALLAQSSRVDETTAGQGMEPHTSATHPPAVSPHATRVRADMRARNHGRAFLGTQGDVWDTQWDMALALTGAIVSQLRALKQQWEGC